MSANENRNRAGYLAAVHIRDGEPELEPRFIKNWLIKYELAEEIGGELVPGENPTHLAAAGIAIFNSGEPGYLSDAYKALPDHAAIYRNISPNVLKAMATEVFREGLELSDAKREPVILPDSLAA